MRHRFAFSALILSILYSLAFAEESRAPTEPVVANEGVEVTIPEASRVKRDELCSNACQWRLDYEHEEICGRQHRRESTPYAGGRCVLQAITRYESCLAACPVDRSPPLP